MRKDINVNMRFCSNSSCEEDLRLCALLLALQILKDFLHGCPYRARAYLLALLHGPHLALAHDPRRLRSRKAWPYLRSPSIYMAAPT
jgi:hypothetical protein